LKAHTNLAKISSNELFNPLFEPIAFVEQEQQPGLGYALPFAMAGVK